MNGSRATAAYIGITTYARDKEDHFALPAAYIEAVRRAGGIPLLLTPGETQIEALLAALDGAILTGGGDMDPVHYNGQPHPTIGGIDAERDHWELDLMRRLVEQRLPALCICRGSQVLNVALGGTLLEHLPEHVDGSVAHLLEPDKPIRHLVTIHPGSRLAALVGAGEVPVMSWHHQAIRQPAPGLVVTAHAADGTIEAIEHPDFPWLLGVQWHPELSAAEDPRQQALFDGLVAAAVANRAEIHAAQQPG